MREAFSPLLADERFWPLICRRSEDVKPLIKYKGIHEPKGRVKGFRVEIRPPNSTQKIWVGTFDTRPKAMRAFDAAVYLTGKEPYYFIYPKSYFPTRPSKPPRDFVQSEAKKFAERIDDLKVNPSSFLVDTSKAGSGGERIPLATTPDVKAVEKSITPVLPDWPKPFSSLGEVDECLQNAEYLTVPAELIPPLVWDVSVEEAKADVEEAKVGEKEAELAAFDKGYHHPDFDVLSELFGRDPPEIFFSTIEGEDFIPEYSPSRPASKRKRYATEGAPSVGLCTVGDGADDDWWQNISGDLFDNDPLSNLIWAEELSWLVENRGTTGELAR
jgi:hypothetical protein